jgi:DNA repair exonuclease SbcCD ATPase subunit
MSPHSQTPRRDILRSVWPDVLHKAVTMPLLNRISSPAGLLGFLLLVGSVAQVTSGCHNSRKAEIRDQLDTLNKDSDNMRQTLSDQESQLEAMNQRLRAQQTELNNKNESVQVYMMNHKMAIAALIVGVKGTQVWADSGNQYSEDAKQLGSTLAVVAVTWAVFHMDEVDEVLETMNQADDKIRNLKAEIVQTSSAIEEQRSTVQNSHDHLQLLSQRTAALQQELSQL